jgi:hypothetical protein
LMTLTELARIEPPKINDTRKAKPSIQLLLIFF